MRTRKNVSPQFSKNLDRFTQFLTLVGLTSLIIGGVGVANAIRAFVERERATIATLKSLGAGGATAFAILLTEVMLIACLGVAIGGAPWRRAALSRRIRLWRAAAVSAGPLDPPRRDRRGRALWLPDRARLFDRAAWPRP